jgi:hypothetical protein
MRQYVLDRALRPFIKTFITFYYSFPGNGAGGNLHIVLDDGNIETTHIVWCQNLCKQQKDSFGYFLAGLLLLFTERERGIMYEAAWVYCDELS